MSLLSSLHSGTSGLQANSQELTVVGDNIANVNTIGFRGGRVAFETAFAESLINGTGQLGSGSRVQAIQRMLTQGALLNTGVSTDLALQGGGLFMVRGDYGGIDSTFYTRAGQFSVDANGYLTTLHGLRVQGFAADPTGRLTGALGDLQVGSGSVPPVATSEITLRANLQADAVTPALPFDPANPAQTSNFSTSVAVYDSLGISHQVDVYFRNEGGGVWTYQAMTDGGGVTGGTAGTPEPIASGQLNFDTSGRLVSQTQASSFSPIDAASPQALAFNLGDAISAGGTGVGGITQFASPSTTSFSSQNGSAAGELSAIAVDGSGNIQGTFSNGVSRILGRVGVASFPAEDQLRHVGGNLFLGSVDSGQASVGVAGEGGRGGIVAGALEQSNVDLADQFVRMIAAQRGFQANSKTITTADQLLAELISLKR